MANKFKNTTFRKGYDVDFDTFKKAHKNIIPDKDMKNAYKVAVKSNQVKSFTKEKEVE